MKQVLTESFITLALNPGILLKNNQGSGFATQVIQRNLLFRISKKSVQLFHSGLFSSMKEKNKPQATVGSRQGRNSQEKRKDVEETWQKEDAEDVIILKSKDNILPLICTNISWYWCDLGLPVSVQSALSPRPPSFFNDFGFF